MLNVWTSILAFVIAFQGQGLPEASPLGRSALDARERHSTIQLTLNMVAEVTIDGKNESETRKSKVFYSK